MPQEKNPSAALESYSVAKTKVPEVALDLEQQIDFLQQQLTQAQRLVTVGELASTTTHEFNNLLMTIMNYAKMGLRNKDDASRDKAFNKILDASVRAGKVTSTILGLARSRPGEKEATDLAELVRDTLVLLEKEMQRYRIAIEFEVADEIPRAFIEANQIQRVLINLLVNARQAIVETGTIRIRVYADASKKHVMLSVRDSGPGIAPENLKHLFTPFYSTKKGPDATGKGGTGLGLASCREIVEEHKGTIRLQSTVGKGTMFTIKLPVGD